MKNWIAVFSFSGRCSEADVDISRDVWIHYACMNPGTDFRQDRNLTKKKEGKIMAKVSIHPTNDFCPQTLFLYGTYDDEGQANFGLFCWFSYTWDGEMGVMACIGGNKLTRENIHKRKVFSANLVTEDLLPLADYLGNTPGFSLKKKAMDFETEEGRILPVPVLKASPVAFELEVRQFIPLKDGEVMLCGIRNVLQEDLLADEAESSAKKLAAIAPVRTTCKEYFGWDGRSLGAWGEPGKAVSAAES